MPKSPKPNENIEQAELASDMIKDAKELIENRNMQKRMASCTKQKLGTQYTWPIILEAALVKNRIWLEKSEDARKIKDWEAAKKHLPNSKQAFIRIGTFEISKHW